MIRKTGFLKRIEVAMVGLLVLMLAVPVDAQEQSGEGPPPPIGGELYVSERQMTTGERVRATSRVVWAKVLSSEVRNDRGMIVTDTEFEILEMVKGSFPGGSRPGDRFVVRAPGGRIGDQEYRIIPPMPTFTPGEEVILFAGPDASHGKAVISPSQSAYRVRVDSRGRRTMAKRPTDLALHRAETGQAYKRAPARLSVEDFLFSLRMAIRN